MDWKDVLGQLKDSGDLPEGEAPEVNEPVEAKPRKDSLRILIDKKGRNGKIATIIEGFTVSDEQVAEIAALLKKKLGVGGSSRGGEILIQGNLAEKVENILREEGYKVKRI